MEVIDYLRPDKTKIVLSLIFLGILFISAVAAAPVEMLVTGEIHIPEDESAAADAIYLVSLVIATYLQSVAAVWWLDKQD